MDFGVAIGLFQQGDLTGAEAHCLGILAQNPKHVAALQMLSLLLKQQGRIGDAAQTFAKVVENQPDLPENWANLGALRRAAGDSDGAAHSFRVALSLSPAHEAAAFNLANLLGGASGDENGAVQAESWY